MRGEERQSSPLRPAKAQAQREAAAAPENPTYPVKPHRRVKPNGGTLPSSCTRGRPSLTGKSHGQGVDVQRIQGVEHGLTEAMRRTLLG